ncbi:glycosyl transferase [Flagellimonas marinaquae]|uniref:Glycosyl transferase n=1 Tax=Flagellimonas marinaquae TaxID=254955 RepID=A0AA48KQ37_9FLAO|nr:glycosyl transferase [Allomuricauda aquimarina]
MENKKRIAFVISRLTSGGAQRVVTTLANELTSKFDITIITFSNVTPFYKIDKNIKLISCFPEESIPPSANFIDSIKLNFKIYRKIGKIIEDQKIQLVIGFITQANILSILAAKRKGIPCIVSERTNPKRANTPKFWSFLRKLTYPKADSLVVQTKNVKNYYLNKIPTNRITILPNPINKELTIKRDLKNKENIVLAVGRLHKLKNHAMAIEAFHKANPKGWKLKILGEGSEMNKLQELIADKNNIELLGSKTNIEDYYNKAKIFLFTSNYEGFPNALLEAMHFGLAPISTDCESGPSEIIEDGKNGYLVEVKNVDQMAERLKLLTTDENLLTNIRNKAENSTQGYLSENVSRSWYNLMNSKLN